MNARLTIYFVDRPLLRFRLNRTASYVLGRDSRCDLRIADDRISRRHARFSCNDQGWTCEDLGSKNGVQINGVTADQHLLATAGWLDLGGLLAQFEILPEATLRAEQKILARRREHGVEITRGIDVSAELPDLLDGVLDSMLALSGTQRGFVMLSNGDDFELRATRELDATQIGNRNFSGSLSTVRDVVRSGSPAVACDALALSNYGERPSVIAGAIRGLVCLPLRMQGSIGGVVYADSPEPGKVFDELDLELLNEFADRAAVAIGAAQLREEIASLRCSLERVRENNSMTPADEVPIEAHWLTLGELLRTHAVG